MQTCIYACTTRMNPRHEARTCTTCKQTRMDHNHHAHTHTYANTCTRASTNAHIPTHMHRSHSRTTCIPAPHTCSTFINTCTRVTRTRARMLANPQSHSQMLTQMHAYKRARLPAHPHEGAHHTTPWRNNTRHANACVNACTHARSQCITHNQIYIYTLPAYMHACTHVCNTCPNTCIHTCTQHSLHACAQALIQLYVHTCNCSCMHASPRATSRDNKPHYMTPHDATRENTNQCMHKYMSACNA